jgi:hypothetical protein
MDVENLTQAYFSIDGVPDFFFEGVYEPRFSWNGFACPWFSKAEAERLCAEAEKLHKMEPDTYDLVEFDYDKNNYRIYNPAQIGSDESMWVGKSLVHEGETYYAVGGWFWIWEAYTFDHMKLVAPKTAEWFEKRSMFDENVPVPDEDLAYMEPDDFVWTYVTGLDGHAYLARAWTKDYEDGEFNLVFNQDEAERMLGKGGWKVTDKYEIIYEKRHDLIDVCEADCGVGATYDPFMIGADKVYPIGGGYIEWEAITPEEAFEMDPNAPDPFDIKKKGFQEIVDSAVAHVEGSGELVAVERRNSLGLS